MKIPNKTEDDIINLYNKLGSIDKVRTELKISRSKISKIIRKYVGRITLPILRNPNLLQTRIFADRNRRLLKPPHVTFSIERNKEEWLRQQNDAFVSIMRKVHPGEAYIDVERVRW